MLSRHTVRWAVAAFGGFLACGSSFARADANSEFEQRREEERKNYDSMIGNMPSLDERTIGGLLRIVVENKVLVVRTPLANSDRDGYMRVKVTDLGITALVRVTGIAPAAASPAKPNIFQFNCTDYRKPLQIATLAVTLQPTTCTINKSTQFPNGGYGNVCLTQQTSEISTGGGPVQLTVNEAGRDGVAPINIGLQAADFFTFVRLYPHQTDAYIRPLLRELGQENVFAPDPLIAWQVFAEIWAPDPATSRLVNELLPALNEDDFRARDRALRELQKLGRDGASVMMHLDRRGLSPEQNSRIDLALGPYPQIPARDALRLRADPAFLLDCLYADDVPLRKIALVRLRELTDPAIQFDIAVGPEGRATAVAGLRQRLLGSK